MGSDDLFRKRKERNKESLRRRMARRNPYDVVLIVCEGGKTEPQYFCELRSNLKLNNLNVVVTGECGSDPCSVVDHAIEKAKIEGDYDRVFCVFDKDRHPNYSDALDKIQHIRLKKSQQIKAITSVPCFEFWILLHFEYTTRPFDSIGKRSICDSVIRCLKRYIPNYEKGRADIFHRTKADIDTAIQNAKKVVEAAKSGGTDNPSTLVHELVQYLQSLK